VRCPHQCNAVPVQDRIADVAQQLRALAWEHLYHPPQQSPIAVNHDQGGLLSQTPLPAAPPVPASLAPLRRPKGTNLQVRPGPENYSTYRTPLFAPIHEMVIVKGRDESWDGGGADPLQGLSCLFAVVTAR
jgi:hypothetical protein